MDTNNKKSSVLQKSLIFLGEVKKEISQVIWPTRNEAGITTLVVCIFAFIMSIYLFIVDRSLLAIIQSIMG
ncbi:MAG: preprotein translocase subunit SecE [Holosporales bacterium]|jgi:preprotein translocase subunit SecE|nr:preprotein translocase subunit SecE [Holosporales bacterium]